MRKLLSFLNQLDARSIYYDLGHHRPDTLMVKVQLPRAHWEVEFFEGGHVEVEVFLSEGLVDDEECLEALLLEEDALSGGGPGRA